MYIRKGNSCLSHNSLQRSSSTLDSPVAGRSFHTLVNNCTSKASKYSHILPKTTVYSKQNLHLKMENVSTKETSIDRSVDVTKKFNIQRAKAGQCSRTLVIIFGFYGAPKNAVMKYCNLYHSYGFDAIFVHSYLKHFAWPKNSIGLATELLDYVVMKCWKYENIVIHAFSMGAYNFTLCMSEMYKCPERYSSVERRIIAVVYDSLTIGTLKHMAEGVGRGLSQNSVIQKIVPMSMSMYFKLTNKYTVQVYEYYINLFKQRPLKVPTLVFYCENDPMSDYKDVEALVNDWRNRFSFDVTGKCWESSKHSAHLIQHKDEYTSTLDQFLNSVPDLVKIESKI